MSKITHQITLDLTSVSNADLLNALLHKISHREILQVWEKLVPADFADAELAQKALDLHGSNEINIDSPAMISETDDGTWVAAWVWVPKS